jgi:hypothetical protein
MTLGVLQPTRLKGNLDPRFERENGSNFGIQVWTYKFTFLKIKEIYQIFQMSLNPK